MSASTDLWETWRSNSQVHPIETMSDSTVEFDKNTVRFDWGMSAIAFPTIEIQGDLEQIEKEYQCSQTEASERCRKLQKEFDVFGYGNVWDGNLYGPHIPWRDTMPPSFREKYALELDEIEVLREFSHGLSGRPLLLHSYSHLIGNSSEKPKTVGEIAAQLRRARERYLEIAKEMREMFPGINDVGGGVVVSPAQDEETNEQSEE